MDALRFTQKHEFFLNMEGKSEKAERIFFKRDVTMG